MGGWCVGGEGVVVVRWWWWCGGVVWCGGWGWERGEKGRGTARSRARVCSVKLPNPDHDQSPRGNEARWEEVLDTTATDEPAAPGGEGTKGQGRHGKKVEQKTGINRRKSTDKTNRRKNKKTDRKAKRIKTIRSGKQERTKKRRKRHKIQAKQNNKIDVRNKKQNTSKFRRR